MKGIFGSIPWIGKLFILIGIYLITEYLFIFISAGIIQLIYSDIHLLELVSNLNKLTDTADITTEQRNALKWYQGITSIGRFLIVSLIFVYMCGERPADYLSLRRSPTAVQWLLIPFILIVCSASIGMVQQWNEGLHLPAFMADTEALMRDLEDRAQLQTDLFLEVSTVPGLLINILIVCIIAAVGEEFLFRGVIQQTIFRGTQKIHLSIWLSAFFFSFIHLQFFGFFPRLLLGALMGYLLYYSGSLWAPIWAHFLNNLVTVSVYFAIQTGRASSDLKESGPWWAGLIGLPFVFLLLWYYARQDPGARLTYGKRLDADLHNGGQDAG